MNNNNLVVASFKNIDGDIIKTLCFDKETIINGNIVPKDTICYYIYSKENDMFIIKNNCQIGKSLKDAAIDNKDNTRLQGVSSILENQDCEYAYLVMNNKEYIMQIDENTQFVNNFNELVLSFMTDIKAINCNKHKRI